MNITAMYCSGCDRDVAVVVTDGAPDDAQANVTSAEVACLEVGSTCSGSLCPLGAAEPSAMVHRLLRHGLPTDQLTRVTGHCESCDFEVEFALVGENRASCLVCGTTRAWDAAL
jgi:hypothetical protein